MMKFKKALKKLGDTYRKVVRCRGYERQTRNVLEEAIYMNHPVIKIGKKYPPRFTSYLGSGGKSAIMSQGWSTETPCQLRWWTKGHALFHPMTFLIKYAPQTWRKSDLELFNYTTMTTDIESSVHPDLIAMFDLIYNNNTSCLFFRVNGVIPTSEDMDEYTNMDEVSKIKQWCLFVRVLQKVFKEWLPANMMSVTEMSHEYNKDDLQERFARLRGSLWYCTGMYNHLAEYIKLVKDNKNDIWSHPCADMDPRARHKILISVAHCVSEDYVMKASAALSAAKVLQETLPLGKENWHVGGEVYYGLPFIGRTNVGDFEDDDDDDADLLASCDDAQACSHQNHPYIESITCPGQSLHRAQEKESDDEDDDDDEWWEVDGVILSENKKEKEEKVEEGFLLGCGVGKSEEVNEDESEKVYKSEKELEFEIAIKGGGAESTLQALRKILPEGYHIRERKRRLSKAEYKQRIQENRADRLEYKRSDPSYIARNQRMLDFPKDIFLHITESSEATEDQENNLDTPQYKQHFRVNLATLYSSHKDKFSLDFDQPEPQREDVYRSCQETTV